MSHRDRSLTVLAALLVLIFAAAAAQTKPVSTATPESVGFSSQRLDRLHALIQDEINNKELAGAVTILARHGKIVDYRTYGQRDIASGAAMTKDTIFRDYSMTKPITGVAMMILYEQGKWLPTDPISKYVPEFANLKVYNGKDADGKMVPVDPEHAPTMGELMSHTAGFIYGFGNTPVDEMYHQQNVMASKNLQEMIDKLATIPLAYQPGKAWQYSVSMDVEGYIIEKLSGKSLPDFVRDNITVPLGMTDTGFHLTTEQRARLGELYKAGPDGKIVPMGTTFDMQLPLMASGGAGILSTPIDYYRFAQMLGNGGELNGTRVLASSSVKLMGSNHVPTDLLTGKWGIGQHIMRPGFGYGFNCAVVFDPPAAESPVGKGTFFWDGAAGTWFWVDRTNDIVFVAMIQRMTAPDNHPIQYKSHAIVYGALVDPAK